MFLMLKKMFNQVLHKEANQAETKDFPIIEKKLNNNVEAIPPNNTLGEKVMSNSLIQVVARKSVKGPGKVLAVVATQADADAIIAAETKEGIKVIAQPLPETVVETPDQYFARRDAENAESEKKTAAMAKLSEEDLIALGLKRK